jgi:hypothetical protein
MFKRYTVEIELTDEMLGTNSMSPDIHAEHIIGKARKIMAGTEPGNKKLDKFIDALPITDEQEQSEKAALIKTLEERYGALPEETKAAYLRGELSALKETVEELSEKGITVFFRDQNGKPCIGSHMVKGFMKSASDALCRAAKEKKNGTILQSSSYTSSIINQHVAIQEKFITPDTDIARKPDGSPVYNTRSLRAMTMQGPRVSIAKSETIPAGAKFKFTLKVLDGSPLDKKALDKIFSYGEAVGLGQWRNAGHGQFKYNITEQ